MPTYLCHGFRWHRRDIRIFVILNDIEDAAPNWLVAPATSFAILTQFNALYNFLPEPRPPTPPRPPPPAKRPQSPLAYDPDVGLKHRDDDHSMPPSRVAASKDPVLMNSWSPVKLLEEFDPEDMSMPSRPYAYVADYVVRVDLSADLADEMGKYRKRQQQQQQAGEWFNRLRDELQKGEDIRWYVVVCGDEVREVPGAGSDTDSNDTFESDDDDDVPTPIDIIPDGLRPPPLRPSMERRPRTSPAMPMAMSSTASLPMRPSPLGSHPANPPPKVPPKPVCEKQLPSSPPPLKSKKSVAEGFRRLFGKREPSSRKEAPPRKEAHAKRDVPPSRREESSSLRVDDAPKRPSTARRR